MMVLVCNWELVKRNCGQKHFLGTRLKFPKVTGSDCVSISGSGDASFFAQPKSQNGTPEPRNLLEPVGLQSWVSGSRGALLRVYEDQVGGFRGLLQHLYELEFYSGRWNKVLAKHSYIVAISERVP